MQRYQYNYTAFLFFDSHLFSCKRPLPRFRNPRTWKEDTATLGQHGREERSEIFCSGRCLAKQVGAREGAIDRSKPSFFRFLILLYRDVDEVPQEKVRRLTKEELDERIPVVRPDMQALASPPPQHVQVTWVGKCVFILKKYGFLLALGKEGSAFPRSPVVVV